MDQYDDEILELEVVAAATTTAVNLILLLVEATQYDRTPFVNRREHTNANLRRLYDESDIIYHNMLRMNKVCLISFYDRLRGKGLRASKHLDVEEQVAIFFLIVGQDTRFRHAQASTMRSLETISKYFHVVLKYVLRLGKDLIEHATPDSIVLEQWMTHSSLQQSPFKINLGVMARYYVVYVGRVPRVYETWEETHPQVSGFRGAVHRRVNSRAEAYRLVTVFIEKERHA
ncbi:hypothetical protein GIB67_020781 [Kingdonia uniflora]|uniref:Uncharacterized protein n=1 Tax=Kingdonia uniflora TaxID=39325 RepID=A0A7J7M7H3_9MAGN|nr:hypothetical protein GIB67_020781 [Kingdonia uniflora]